MTCLSSPPPVTAVHIRVQMSPFTTKSLLRSIYHHFLEQGIGEEALNNFQRVSRPKFILLDPHFIIIGECNAPTRKLLWKYGYSNQSAPLVSRFTKLNIRLNLLAHIV